MHGRDNGGRSDEADNKAKCKMKNAKVKVVNLKRQKQAE